MISSGVNIVVMEALVMMDQSKNRLSLKTLKIQSSKHIKCMEKLSFLDSNGQPNLDSDERNLEAYYSTKKIPINSHKVKIQNFRPCISFQDLIMLLKKL